MVVAVRGKGGDFGATLNVRSLCSRTHAVDPELPVDVLPSRTGMQRLLPVGVAKRTHATCHEAAVGSSFRGRLEWQLYVVLRSLGIRERLAPRHRLLRLLRLVPDSKHRLLLVGEPGINVGPISWRSALPRQLDKVFRQCSSTPPLSDAKVALR
jgi:hypothetical protein